MTPKELEFWTRVRYRNEKLQEQIRIRRRREFATAIMPPAGSPPFAYRPAFRIAGRRPVSQAEIDEARQLFRHRNAIHRADEPYSSVEEYACGVYRLEMREAREKAFARSCWTAPVAKDAYARTYMDGLGPKADSDNGAAAALGAWQQGPQPISHDEWRARGYSVSSLLDALTLSREDRELLARVLAKSPGKSRGRPPMIVRERKRPGRPNWKQPKPTPAAPLQLAKSRRHGS